MSISRIYFKKYRTEIDQLRKLGIDDGDIEDVLQQKEDFNGWKRITLKELMKMNEGDLSKLMSYCWHDGRPRCDTIGITDLKVEERKSGNVVYYHVEFSDGNGDPSFEVRDINQELHKVGDGEWDYGLYKEIKKK